MSEFFGQYSVALSCHTHVLTKELCFSFQLCWLTGSNTFVIVPYISVIFSRSALWENDYKLCKNKTLNTDSPDQRRRTMTSKIPDLKYRAAETFDIIIMSVKYKWFTRLVGGIVCYGNILQANVVWNALLWKKKQRSLLFIWHMILRACAEANTPSTVLFKHSLRIFCTRQCQFAGWINEIVCFGAVWCDEDKKYCIII